MSNRAARPLSASYPPAMTYLDLRQARRLRDALLPLHQQAPTPRELPALLSATINDLVGGELTCFDVFDRQGQLQNLGGNAPSLFNPETTRRLSEHVREHPLFTGIFVERRDIPLKISDFCPSHQYHKRDIYQQFYRPLGIAHQLVVGFEVPGLGFTTCALSRGRRDFTEAERVLLAFAQPHLALLLEQAGRQLATAAGPAPTADLTPRETAILRCLAQGQPDKAIAHHCGISPRTVQVHLRNIYAKLGVDNRTAAALAFNN